MSFIKFFSIYNSFSIEAYLTVSPCTQRNKVIRKVTSSTVTSVLFFSDS